MCCELLVTSGERRLGGDTAALDGLVPFVPVSKYSGRAPIPSQTHFRSSDPKQSCGASRAIKAFLMHEKCYGENEGRKKRSGKALAK